MSAVAEEPIRWGILATGWIAQMFTKDLVLTGRDVRAVGSRSLENAQAFAAEFGIPTAHGSYEELANDPEVDIVYVSTPHTFHAENAIMMLNAGKHVLVEKPFTLNGAEARAVVDLAASKGLLVLEAMWTRFLPHVARIREIIEGGTLGELRQFNADHRQKAPTDPGHRMNALELGGGALLDLGIYPISFAAHLFGTPESVQAAARFQAGGADSQVATIFHYADGQLATTISALDTLGPNVATIVGTDARIDIDAVWYTPTTFRVVNSAGDVVESFDEFVEGRGMQFQAFEAERLIRAGEIASPLLSPEESVSIMETMDEIRRQIGLVYPGE
ncbi:Gfo/Idh/MocA family oxidoreductase [Diaminobutyricibacter tongyongensis]|uniref:Gfo/Idh/MocA family oxidoreductase n=1 Tax=Leifsonia tongyongensis TaxID=1268043 RepID=A0A6L9Y0U8_9MICO|nr:Gfo/Idh/MocA family oxidoreductase [Diaminobutyricibacter tongyongensis]NEN06914.1 Gfo/Idh/MocA family oxidoreductase [Diaminobutyricibacter tongyongensis]